MVPKINMVDHVLKSFNETLDLPPAAMPDIEDYRTYLAIHNPIAEIETRFLDTPKDLVCLTSTQAPASNRSVYSSSGATSPVSDGLLTPVPYKTTFGKRTLKHKPHNTIKPSC